MALWVCGQCSAAYPPGLPACPQCGGTDHRPDYEEDAMSSKATYEGVSYDPGKEPPGWVAPEGDAAAPEPPSPKAPKAELVEHAVNVVGVDPDEAQAMTKAELAETIQAAAPPPPPPPGA